MEIRHVIDGVELDSLDSARFESINPWTREPWANVALGSAADAERATSAARRAFDEGPWPRMGHVERGRLLHRLATLIEEHAAEFAKCDSSDMGKPMTDLLTGDVPRSADFFRFFADHARLSTSECFPMDSGHHVYERFDAAGVVAAIAPWNFPLLLESWRVAPALAWGNTVVLKPAEDSPSSANVLALLALEAGIPEGVLNVVHGYGSDGVGAALTRSRLVDRVVFTGESSTGRAVAAAAAANLVPVSLELGGKGANIVFADANMDNAVDWATKAVFSNAGQVCLAGSRLLVERSIFAEFLDRMVAGAENLRLGDPADPQTQVGPLASETHFNKVTSYLHGIPTDGGEVVTGGAGDGWAVRPTIAIGLPTTSKASREEIFGPVVVVHPFDGEDQAIRMANDTPYGLSALCFTENLGRAHRVADRLRAGTVWINCFRVRDLRAPFGGIGDSGIGREGGNYSREFFTEPKSIVMATS